MKDTTYLYSLKNLQNENNENTCMPETCLVCGQNAGQNCMGEQNIGWFWGRMKILKMFAT